MMTTETANYFFEETPEKTNTFLDNVTEKEREVLNVVKKFQSVIGKVTPVVTKFERLASPADLKSRLDWGEPALSIVDVRDREAFNQEHITGAIAMSIDRLVELSNASFDNSRDIFVCAGSPEHAVEAVTQLQTSGFERVSVIDGGLPAWKAIGGQTEGYC